jgi:hypothetical protein
MLPPYSMDEKYRIFLDACKQGSKPALILQFIAASSCRNDEQKSVGRPVAPQKGQYPR